MLRFSEEAAHRLRCGPRHVVVTGASGWLGQATLEMLSNALGSDFPQRVFAFGSRSRAVLLRSGQSLPIHQLGDLRALDVQSPLIFHYAFLTKDRLEGLSPEAYRLQNASITETLGRFVERSNAFGLFLPSSGALYAALRSDSANLYAQMKLDDEHRFAEITKGRGTRLAVCRIFNISGPFINKVRGYALGSILQDIRNGGPIVLHARKPVLRSYMHVQDVVEVAARVLFDDYARTPTFDTVGSETVEVEELACYALAALNRSDICIERAPLDPDAVPDRYVGDGELLRELLKRYDLTPQSLDRQILDTAEFLGLGPLSGDRGRLSQA